MGNVGVIARKVLALSGLVVMLATGSGCVGEDPAPSDNGTSGESAIDSGDPKAPAGEATTLDIQTVRNPTAPNRPAPGARVQVSGVVTGIKTAGAMHGFFLRNPGAPDWSSIYVYVGPANVEHTVGTIVKATGRFTTFRGFDEIDVTSGTVEATGTADVPAPVEVTVEEIANGGSRADALQSVLVVVKNVTCTRATTSVDFSVKQTSGGAELYVTAFMASDVGPVAFSATLNQKFSSIRGFGFKFGASDATAVAKLAPISGKDLVVAAE